MKTGFVYDPIYLEHHWKGHPENKDRLIAIIQELERKGILKELIHISPRRAIHRRFKPTVRDKNL